MKKITKIKINVLISRGKYKILAKTVMKEIRKEEVNTHATSNAPKEGVIITPIFV